MKIECLSGFYNQIFKTTQPARPDAAGLPSRRSAGYYFPLQFFKLKTAIMRSLLCTYESIARQQWRVKIYTRLLFVFFVLAFTVLKGQSQSITGKVTDANGKPLPGATVTVKGAKRTVVTNTQGDFSIPAKTTDKLLISYVNYKDQEVPASVVVSGIKLQPTDKTLDDVVVVGYGTRKKATLTGSIATVDSKVFQDRGPTANPLAALQGQVPGVVVTRTAAAPGREGWNFQIRGATSTNGTDPLVIVDGIPLVSLNALNSINPNDIDNMSFLKDASAAIYGARGAGGVVLITTKKAKSGKPTIQYDGSVSFKKIGLQPHLINVKQFGQGLVDGTTNDFYGVAPTSYIWYKFGQLQLNAPDSGYLDMNVTYNMDWATGKLTYVGTPTTPSSNPANPGFGDVKDFTFFNTNWVDELWGTATSNQHNISMSARNDKSGYRLSLGYMNDGSLLKWGNNSNKRYNLRLSHDYTFSDKFKLETIIALEKNDIVQPTQAGAVLGQYQQPGFPIATKLGQPYGWGTQYSPNWLAALGGDQDEYNTRIFANMRATYSFTRHLRLIGQSGYNWNATDIKTQQKTINNWYNYAGYQKGSPDNPSQANSYYQRQLIKDPYYNINAYLEYQNTFKGLHDFGATVGTNYERDELNSYTARTNYIANDNVPSLNLGIGDATTKSVTESQSHYAIGSYFGRLNYAYNNKYLFEANARYDGSSKFAAADRWKLFYGFSAGWRLIQEKFMKGVSFLDDLKLRASFGTVGNQSGINLYDYLQLLNVSSNTTGATNNGFPIIGTGTVVYTAPTASLVSLNRTWEKVQTKNLGLDFALLKNRLSGSFDYFIKDNINMLLGQQFPAVLGATAPSLNLGHLRTHGWEALISWRDNIGKFNYHVSATITDNNNTLISYSANSVIAPGYNTAVQGYAIGSYFGLQYAGRAQDQKTLDAYRLLAPGNNISMPLTTGTLPGVRLGDNMYVDQNKDGKLTTPADLVYLGRDDPRYTYAANLGAEWKGFDFSATFQGVGKRTIFREGNWRVPFGSIFQGQTDFWVGKTWTPSNTGAYYPVLSVGQNGTTYNTYNYQVSTWSVENGAYVRLKNLVLGYTIPQHIMQKAKIQKLRIYFSGNDLWEASHIRDGWDPEATRNVGRANNESTFSRYPFYRYMTFGVNVTF